MSTRKYFAIITDVGQSKIAEAMAGGQKLNVTTFLVGDGNGEYYVPTSDMTAIKNEVWRGTISKADVVQDAQKILRITTVIPAEVSGFIVREIALLDETEELVAIGNTPDLPKVRLEDGASTELKLTMRLAVKNTEALSFTIDPHTVIMTKDMLDTHNVDDNAHNELFEGKYDKTGGTISGNVVIQGNVAEGNGLTANISNSRSAHAEGEYTTTFGRYVHAEGGGCVASSDGSHVEGAQTIAGGLVLKIKSIDAENKTITFDDTITSFSIIFNAIVINAKLHIINTYYINDATRVTVESVDTTNHSIVVKETIPSSNFNPSYAVVLVSYNSVRCTHAEGYRTIASGDCTHAEGYDTTASGSNSHAEGTSTEAKGNYSHAEGSSTTASGSNSHAEGWDSVASSKYSHSEGYQTIAGSYVLKVKSIDAKNKTIIFDNTYMDYGKVFNEIVAGTMLHVANALYSNNPSNVKRFTVVHVDSINHSVIVSETIPSSNFSPLYAVILKMGNSDEAAHAEGHRTIAKGSGTHAEGYNTIAKGLGTHAEGYDTIANSYYSHAEGDGTTASGSSSHAEGTNTKATEFASHAEGFSTEANGRASHAEGEDTVADGSYSHAEGGVTKALSNYSHAEGGNNTTASDMFAHAEGQYTTASGNSSHSEGLSTKASGGRAHAEGHETKASGEAAHAEGYYTTASGNYSHAGGYYTTANNLQTVIGKYNTSYTGGSETGTSGSAFIIGNGTSNSARSNCFRVQYNGVTYSKGSYNTSGADYAEYFEWLDGNTKKEDRTGLFVTLDGEKIRIATPDDDYILGIVSACPSIVGNAQDDQWGNMYEKDVFGREITEEIDVPDKVIEMPDPENSERTITQVICEAHKEIVPKLNIEYDNTQKYIPRSERPEWDTIGMLGKLVTVDDGSCEVNGWCKVGKGGVATKSEKRTKFRVISRLDKNHIRVLIL